MFSFWPCCCARGIVVDASVSIGATWPNGVQSENICLIRGAVPQAFGPPNTIAGGTPIGFSTNQGRQPQCMGNAAGSFWVGFTGGVNPNGSAKPSLARYTAGAWTPETPTVAATYSLCDYNGTIAIIGLDIGDGEHNAVWRLLGSTWSKLEGLALKQPQPGLIDVRPILRFFNNKLYASGNLLVDGEPASLAVWNGIGWLPVYEFGEVVLNPPFTPLNKIIAMETDGNRLIVGGSFRTFYGAEYEYLAIATRGSSFTQMGTFTSSFVPSGGFGKPQQYFGQIDSIVFHQVPATPLNTGAIGVGDTGATIAGARKLSDMLVWWRSGITSYANMHQYAAQHDGLWSVKLGSQTNLAQVQPNGTPTEASDMLSDGARLIACGGAVWQWVNGNTWLRLAENPPAYGLAPLAPRIMSPL